MSDIIAKYYAQKKLFSCNVSRLNLLDLKIENTKLFFMNINTYVLSSMTNWPTDKVSYVLHAVFVKISCLT